ncbi:DUF3450 domain-containing protein [Endozoicomonas gorgoniicola]|uniref:DUF3450 domain-containing protein n=1 Tax=Endozoicomonas gorgoniicola TaxID=1234144 RepID=A0ABT3N3U7_9GAMM|nr:DUF3450 domain-containing protein [Endozoicomonas gorgoniicola]MCW7556281.1 DUF3450 domain-containing protein [Endozoicomonas gorgoniicola]
MSFIKKSTILSLLILAFNVQASNTTLKEIEEVDQYGISASQKAQPEIEQLDDTRKMQTQENRQLIHELQLTRHYQNQLNRQLEQLNTALAELDQQREILRRTRMELTPLMERMNTALKTLVKADQPFLQDERKARLANLDKLFNSADLNEGDKLARLLDAYQVELSYGYSVESWQGMLNDDRLVTFLRIGRLYFYYLSLDGKEGAIHINDQWVSLPEKQLSLIKTAIEVANGQLAPAMMNVPVAREK